MIGHDSLSIDSPGLNMKSYVGLVNLGHTCYLNCLLQSLYHIPILRKMVRYFLNSLQSSSDSNALGL